MSSIVTPKMQPRIVSLAELRAKLLPLCLGYAWAEGAIVDLWLKGAPVPQPASEPERRILIPTHFAAWWAEVQQRMGLDVTAQQIFTLRVKDMRTHAGLPRSR